QLLEVLKKQAAVVKTFSEPMIVAYEPVWAIGTGKVATIKDIEEAHKILKDFLPGETPILYGGSVNSANAGSILLVKNVDGLLVGGASLKFDEFQKIVESVS
ncbi:MAG: tpiA, partial [Bacteriovoracaceae bacterium]|nr:tpiA [Bacteriovoracaceae bacterium]